MTEKKIDYGRQTIRNYAAEKRRENGPACEKCRHLEVRNNACCCAMQHPLEPASCLDYRDASTQTDWMPHFDYNGRFRR